MSEQPDKVRRRKSERLSQSGGVFAAGDRLAGEVAAIEGPLRDQVIAVSSQEIYERWLNARSALAEAVAHGALRPTHLRGRKPI